MYTFFRYKFLSTPRALRGWGDKGGTDDLDRELDEITRDQSTRSEALRNPSKSYARPEANPRIAPAFQRQEAQITQNTRTQLDNTKRAENRGKV